MEPVVIWHNFVWSALMFAGFIIKVALVFFQIRANPPNVLFKRVRQITSDMANFQLTQPGLYASSWMVP